MESFVFKEHGFDKASIGIFSKGFCRQFDSVQDLAKLSLPQLEWKRWIQLKIVKGLIFKYRYGQNCKTETEIMVIFHQKNTIFFSWNHYSANKIRTKTLFACHYKWIAKHIYLSNYFKCWLQRKYNFKLLIIWNVKKIQQ